MTPDQIAELFIQAAETEKRLPQTAKPARLKAMALPYVHDQKDQNGWGSERYADERADFFDARSTRLTKNQVAVWELSLELVKLVRKPENRRALWAWANSKAGGMFMAKWARTIENVHPETVTRRAKASITEIHHKLECNGELHNQNDIDQVLPSEPEIGHKTSNIEVWRPEESKPLACHFDTDIAGMEYADIQNARRRERRARRQQAA